MWRQPCSASGGHASTRGNAAVDIPPVPRTTSRRRAGAMHRPSRPPCSPSLGGVKSRDDAEEPTGYGCPLCICSRNGGRKRGNTTQKYYDASKSNPSTLTPSPLSQSSHPPDPSSLPSKTIKTPRSPRVLAGSGFPAFLPPKKGSEELPRDRNRA